MKRDDTSQFPRIRLEPIRSVEDEVGTVKTFPVSEILNWSSVKVESSFWYKFILVGFGKSTLNYIP